MSAWGLSAEAWGAVWLTVQLAGITTVLLLVVSLPLAWWLAHTQSRTKAVVGALVALPLVLPPTVLGFYLLVGMGPNGPLGVLMAKLGLPPLAFTFNGLVLGSVIYSLPFAVQPIQHAFEAMGKRPMEVAATLRMRPWEAFAKVALPLAKPGIVTASILSFAHTVGEFGVVLMIGGNVPGQTRVVSTQIYGHVEGMQYQQAHVLALGMLVFCFLVLLAVGLLNRRTTRVGF